MSTLISNVQCYHHLNLNTKHMPAMIALIVYVVLTYGLFAYSQSQYLTRQKYATDFSIQNFNSRLAKLAY